MNKEPSGFNSETDSKSQTLSSNMENSISFQLITERGRGNISGHYEESCSFKYRVDHAI